MNVSSSKLIRFTRHAYETASKTLPDTQWQHMALLCLKERTRQKWEGLPDMLVNMPYVCEILQLEKIPHFTT